MTTCDHGIRLDRWCADCEQGVTFPDDTPAESRWFATFMLAIAAVMGLCAVALALRLVFEMLGVIR